MQLPMIVEALDNLAIFWLDAHFSAGPTWGESKECPLLSEIEAINASDLDNIILIDDARLFQAPPAPPHKIEHWPDIGQVIGKLTENKARHVAIIDDVIIATPARKMDVVSNFLRNYIRRNPPEIGNAIGWPFSKLDIRRLMYLHGITPKGVVHVGAHVGQELVTYLQIGFKHALLVEANPEVFKRLVVQAKTIIQKFPDSKCQVKLAPYAVSDINGEIDFHVNIHDQSSSLLPLKQHKEIYPDMIEKGTITVPSITLDDLVENIGYKYDQFNVINIDIQGAELLALKGAGKILHKIDAICAEVNFGELYENCTLVSQLDDYLRKYGFKRIATYHPAHIMFGDAFYVKKIKVSAIVSTYCGEALIKDRMQNLVDQTLFKTGCMEIVVVDSGSPQNERIIVDSFLHQYPDRIRYIRTARETISAAWNRAVEIARGEYLTVQNVDDRMKLDSIEKLACYLDENPSCVLVHGDQESVPRGRDFDLQMLSHKRWNWGAFIPELLLLDTQVGSQPMWRTTAHYHAGYFDSSLKGLCDLEFYIRLSKVGEFHYIPEVLGSIDSTEVSLSRGNDWTSNELKEVFKRYMSARELSKILDLPFDVKLNDSLPYLQWLRNEYCCKIIKSFKSFGMIPKRDHLIFLKAVLSSVENIQKGQDCIRENLKILNAYLSVGPKKIDIELSHAENLI